MEGRQGGSFCLPPLWPLACSPYSFLVTFFPPLDPSASKLASTRASHVLPTYTCLLFPVIWLDYFHSCHFIEGETEAQGCDESSRSDSCPWHSCACSLALMSQ